MHDVATILQKLPETCFAKLPSTGEVIGIRRGVMGYVPLPKPPDGYTLDQLNEGRATRAQMEAMLAGSLFGWHVPAADPDNYDAEGKFKTENLGGYLEGLGGEETIDDLLTQIQDDEEYGEFLDDEINTLEEEEDGEEET